MYYTYYISPCCKIKSAKMKLEPKIHHWALREELQRMPDFEPIAHEVLQCKCRRLYTWFDLINVTQESK